MTWMVGADGGAIILKNQARIRKGTDAFGIFEDLAADATGQTFTGLENDVGYTIEVLALNSAGSSSSVSVSGFTVAPVHPAYRVHRNHAPRRGDRHRVGVRHRQRPGSTTPVTVWWPSSSVPLPPPTSYLALHVLGPEGWVRETECMVSKVRYEVWLSDLHRRYRPGYVVARRQLYRLVGRHDPLGLPREPTAHRGRIRECIRYCFQRDLSDRGC